MDEVFEDTKEMNRYTLIGISISLIAIAGYFLFGRDTVITNYPSSGTRVIAFGDSLIEGVGAEPGMTLVDQLSGKIGMPIENEGIAGNTTREGVARIDDVLAGEPPKVVILLLGGNDFLKKIPREETYTNLEIMIKKIQGTGSIVLLLGVRSGFIGGGFDDEFEQLAKTYGTAYVDDVLSGVFAHHDLMSDAVHPNGKGYAQIANRITPVIIKLLQ